MKKWRLSIVGEKIQSSGKMSLYQKIKIHFVGWFPPLLFSGIKVSIERRDGILRYRSKLRSSIFNRGVRGTYFGGCAFSMVDPFHMLILMDYLGSDYLIWDKKTSIKFIKPSRKSLHAEIVLSRDEIEAIRTKTIDEGDYAPEFTLQLHDDEGLLVAEVVKTVYVRKVKNERS